jgi:hypothetical protein
MCLVALKQRDIYRERERGEHKDGAPGTDLWVLTLFETHWSSPKPRGILQGLPHGGTE